MENIVRRDVIGLLLVSGGVAVGELSGLSPLLAQTNDKTPVIDVHAHVFNASDIPARSFLKIVVLDHYSEQGVEKLLDFGAPDTVDWLISLFVWIVAGRAPTAKAEIAFLSGHAGPEAAAADINASAMITQQRLKIFMRQLDGPGTESELAPANAPKLPQSKSKAGRERFRAALKKAAAGPARDPSSLAADDSSAAAAYTSITDVGVYLRWFNLFTLYRHTLTDQLAQVYGAQNFKPLLVAPAIVNYSRWLNEDVTSPLEDQVEVMGLVSKRATGAMVHGYVGYDPLAQVYFRRGLQARKDQIALVKSAVEDHGFIGVKLYPPMGFKPLRNAAGQTYPKPILDELGGHLSDDLNAAMEELFQLCITLDIPILSHAAASNGAGPKYADRGDPASWLPALAKYPKLRLCLAHFGRFTYRSAAAPSGSPLPEGSWEWTLGRQIKSNRDGRLFADLSYLTEAQTSDADSRHKLGRQMRQYISEFDPKLERLIYGSDWLMLAKEPRNERFLTDLVGFLKSEVGLTPPTMERVLRSNAIRFLGLARGNAARARLISFYKRHEMDQQRLEIFDTTS